MKLLAAICSLSCILVSLVVADAIYTGHTISQEIGKLPTKRAPGNWTDTSSPQKQCSLGRAVMQSSDFKKDQMANLTNDCQILLDATKNHNGYWDIKPGESLEPASHGSCVLSVNFGLVGIFSDKLSIMLGNSDISEMVNMTLGFIYRAMPNDTVTSASGESWCNGPGIMQIPITWNMTLNESLATDHQAQPTARHKASLAKRETSFPWMSTADSPARMCSNTTDPRLVTGNGTSTYDTVIRNCTDIAHAYNLHNNGYYNISIDAEDRGKFITLATHGVCSLSVIAPSADNVTGSVSFQLGNRDIFEIMSVVEFGLWNLNNLGGDAAVNDTAGALGLVFCGADEGVMVKYAVAFHDFEPDEKWGDLEGTVSEILE
ncbi:hypothetical protein VPNG_06820 [Cytospora leucostoma]|uniref:Ecp2 effector protein-like domain-containing protein n=1 Tax=Cytospora leucostoma TaxID=1230097 RepID=A0A423WVV9_9PEZI|nr:hypothetical protein VPNG_06820 [Cytospora leucostoma]